MSETTIKVKEETLSLFTKAKLVYQVKLGKAITQDKYLRILLGEKE